MSAPKICQNPAASAIRSMLAFETVSAHPSTCHAFSLISFLAWRLLMLMGRRHYVAITQEFKRRTGIATCGAPHVTGQSGKTMPQPGSQTFSERQSLFSCRGVKDRPRRRKGNLTRPSPTPKVFLPSTGKFGVQIYLLAHVEVQLGKRQIPGLVEEIGKLRMGA